MLGSGGGHEGPFDRIVRPPKTREEPRPSSLYVIVEDAATHCDTADELPAGNTHAITLDKKARSCDRACKRE